MTTIAAAAAVTVHELNPLAAPTPALGRTSSKNALVPPTTRAAWKDSTRVAEFVANVAGGVFVVSSLCGYLVQVAATSRLQLPDVGAAIERAAADALQWPSFVHPCWAHSSVHGALTACWRVVHRMDLRATNSHTDAANVRALAQIAAMLGLCLLAALAVRKYKFVGWFCCLQIVVTVQWIVALYQLARIALSMTVYVSVKLVKCSVTALKRAYACVFGVQNRYAASLKQIMKTARTYAEWLDMAHALDTIEGHGAWRSTITDDDRELCDFAQLDVNVASLKRALARYDAANNERDARNAISELQYLAAAVATRNKLGIDAPGLHLSVHAGSKVVIDAFDALAVEALERLANAPPSQFAAEAKRSFFLKLKQSLGATALCLSGGGAIAMYHMGVLRALLQADALPNVISGSSGGSIAAAMAACKTNDELLSDILQNTISTRFIPSYNIRWFPPLMQQLAHCVKTGFLVECSDFEATTQHYYGEPFEAFHKTMHYTFQDAFVKTGRHVCITVSASDITGASNRGPKKLLLNHITSPHVLLWSAVAVSCSLPGIMKGKRLMARDFAGNVVPYTSLGAEWVDGSIQHDLPMETMASCFNVTTFIVSQVNPHVVPFVGDDVDNPNFRKSVFHTLESVIAADVRHRLKMLAFLGLFPKIYGHQFSAYFRQNFSGTVTLIPDFAFLEAIGIKAILNPTVQDMDRYLDGGQRCVWPKLQFIRHLCVVEKALDKELARLLGDAVVPYANWLCPATKVDADSIARMSSTVTR